MEDKSLRGNLIGNRFVVRKGTFTINGDNVSLSMKRSYDNNIDCHHVVGHQDNDCLEGTILQKFDKALGGKASQRGWDYLTFPVWHFSKLPPLPTRTGPKKPFARMVGQFVTWPSSAMIARTDADCHGNVVDGDQLQSDLDASPRTAAGYRGPISYQLTQALSELDDLLGEEADFFAKYHKACITIEADKLAADDFFFSAQTDAASKLLSTTISTPVSIAETSRSSYPLATQTYLRARVAYQRVHISELSPRRFKKLMFTATVFVLEEIRQRPLTYFSHLGIHVAHMFALNESFAYGLLCRILPPSNIIGVNKCAFAHAKEIDAEGRVILDKELTIENVFLGAQKIYGKVLDSNTILAQGSELDDACVVLERRETLHIVEVRQKTPADSEDSEFRIVENAGQLIVGSHYDEETLLRGMSVLSEESWKDAASQTSSLQRAIRVICAQFDFPSQKAPSKDLPTRTFFRVDGYPILEGFLIHSNNHPNILRTAMVSGMSEASDGAKVEKVMRMMHGIIWTRAIRKAVVEMYTKKITKHGDGDVDKDVDVNYSSDMLVHVSTDVRERKADGNAILFNSTSVVDTAALIKAGIALGMRIERPIGTVLMEGNGRDRMTLNVRDDIMYLATKSEFGDGTRLEDPAKQEMELRKKGFCV